MNDRISLTPKILELNNSNDIYMTMNIIILSEDINYNKAQFTSDFIEGVIENKEKFIGIPFLVNREKLENGDVDELTHELDINTGELKTDQIGSFVDFWKEEIDGANCLLGSIRIFKRFSKTCSAIIDLVEDNALETSCEVLVQDYQEISEDGVRKIHYNDGKNALIGSAIVTNGAERRAKPTLLIAEAYAQDISENKGGEVMPKEIKDKIEKFNKDVEIKYHGELETSALKWHEVSQKIYNLVNPVDPENGGRDYNYYIRELFTSYVIFEDWDTGSKLYKADYTVDNNTVTLAPMEDWVKGSYQFVPEGVEINETISQNNQKISELEKELNELKEENKLTKEELQEKIEGLEKEISELQEENQKLEETIVSQKEESNKAETTINELNKTVKELETYKEKVEKAEKEAKVAELNEKYAKLLCEETFKSEDVVNAINSLDEVKLNSIVVAEIAKEKIQTETEKDVIVTASVQEDLITLDKGSYYWASPKGN